ncbi:hypothetical protein V9T40_003318 [Parthenolecanium corni]|uniref:DUF7869 domain-containing protein n=1 Tax=Parthenolecanium corni TaxID=536013 RepID=A0AAN9Y9K5_9HEMI
MSPPRRRKNRVTVINPKSVVACKCSYDCKKLTSEQICELRKKFNKLKYEAQGSYLLCRIILVRIQRRRRKFAKEPDLSRRQCSIRYTIPMGDDLIPVCKRTFMRLFSLSQCRLQLLIERVKKGEVSFVSHAGKNPRSHVRQRKYNEETRNAVIMHVMQFPREVSHYSRAKASGEYLSPDLNVTRLHAKFKEDNPGTVLSQRNYRRTFKQYFWNLSFHRPRTDTCMTCDKFQIAKRGEPHNLKHITGHETHLRQADTARKTMFQHMTATREPDSQTFVAAMDLEKVLFVPTLTHSQMYYSRQLSVFNLCLHAGDTRQGHMFVWHEGTAGRGGNEIGSCLFKFLLSRVIAKRHVEVWCDNCCGQNKNQMLLLVLMYMIATKRYDSIELHFLVSGHSYMPCDQDFAIIEKRKKFVQAMVPSEIKDVIATAKLEQPFAVTDMAPEDFYDFRKVAHKLLNILKLKISSLTAVRVTHSSLRENTILTKTTYRNSEEWLAVKVNKRHIKLLQDIPLNMPRITHPPVLKKEKLADLKNMIEFLEPKYRDFYMQLCEPPSTCNSRTKKLLELDALCESQYTYVVTL